MEGLLRGEREFGVAAAGRAEVGDHEPASHRSATPGPISSITPAASRPGVIGSVGMARGPAALSPVPTVAGSACSMNMFWSKTGRQLTESQIRAAGREAPAGALLAGSGKVQTAALLPGFLPGRPPPAAIWFALMQPKHASRAGATPGWLAMFTTPEHARPPRARQPLGTSGYMSPRRCCHL